MRTLFAAFAMAAGLTCAGSALAPAAAIPFSPSPAQTENNMLTQARWVCNRYHQCIWRGPRGREFYYGPPGWRHCEYHWRPSSRGPYRERLCW